MVKNLLLTLFTIYSLSLSGQFTYSPSPATINIPASSGDHKLEITFNNANDTTYQVYWKIEKSSNFNSNWITYVCDLTTCYFFNVDEIDPEKPNNMPMGNHKFEFHFLPEGVSGTTTVKLNLYQDKAMTEQLLSVNIPINASSTSSTKDAHTSSIKVFPNPAVDYFQITNSTNVKKVVLFNILGKEVKTFYNSHNSLHDVSDLKKGLYIVRMFDDKNKLLKVVRLNKSSDGA